MNLTDPATVILTEIGANALNYNNESFNHTFKRELKTDYKKGDVYENALWVVLSHFADFFNDPDPMCLPFTNLEPAK